MTSPVSSAEIKTTLGQVKMMMNNLLAYGGQQAAAAQLLQHGYGNMANIPMPPAPTGKTHPQPVSVVLKPLPFYDVEGELVSPTALVSRGTNRQRSPLSLVQLKRCSAFNGRKLL